MTQEESQNKFKLHLPGLLKVLAEHLYSNKSVAVRELIQNSHDSCIRRNVEGKDPAYKPRIHLAIDPNQRKLTITDNGSGLTEDDINTYLTTIGRSYTGELSSRLAMFSQTEAYELIGQFGMGFLSAFLIASEITLTTKSTQADSPALRWYSAGGENYEITPAERSEVGTTIELKIKPEASFVLQEQILVETVQKYADFLSFPIFVGADRVPVNLMTPPWESATFGTAAEEYIQRAFRIHNPLCIIPLQDHSIDLGHDEMIIPLRGFLFVPPASIASINEYGDLIVYIRRMFICEGERHLLPPWARFVRGVIDCAYLQPTASRESLHQNETFDAVRQALEAQLLQGLRKIARDQPETWRQMVRGHSDVMTGWAVSDNEFFEHVADMITFRTSRGLLSLPEYLKLTQNRLYFSTRELGSLQQQLLGESHDVPVIDASWFAVKPFLEKYANWHQSISMVQMDGDAKKLLRSVPEGDYQDLLDVYRKQGIKARMASFKPAEVPALVLHPQDAEFLLEARDALDSGEIPGPLAGLVDNYLRTAASNPDEDLHGTLYLNASAPLIQNLIDKPPSTANRDAILLMIHQIARLFSGRTLTPKDVTAAFQQITHAIETLRS